MMVKELMNYIDSTKGAVIKKKDVLESLETTSDAIANIVDPALEAFAKYVSENNVPVKDLKSLSMLNISNGNLKAKSAVDVIKRLKIMFYAMGKETYKLESIAKKELPDLISDSAFTARNAAIVKIISDFHSMALYIPDFLDLVATEMMGEYDSYPKGKKNELIEGIKNFGAMMEIYDTNIADTISKLPKVSSVVIHASEGKESMLEKIVGNGGKKLALPINNFLLNPIYHIRMFMVDREIAKYENLKDKRRLLDLKLLELKSRAANEHNPSLSKQIEYYEEKIAKVEHSIRKIEE